MIDRHHVCVMARTGPGSAGEGLHRKEWSDVCTLYALLLLYATTATSSKLPVTESSSRLIDSHLCRAPVGAVELPI